MELNGIGFNWESKINGIEAINKDLIEESVEVN